MINKMEIWLNILHYNLYKVHYKLHLLANKLNPFLLLGKIPAMKRKFEEQGTTLEEVVNKVWGDKDYGFSIVISGGGLAIITSLIIWSLFLFTNDLFKHPISFSWIPLLASMGIAYIICHFLVFKNDKYIKYFKKFDKWTKRRKIKNGLLSFIFTLVVIIFFIYSFNFLPKP